MAALTPQEREFVERLGLFFEMLGASRTMGRIYAWLMICEPSHQSITEVATALGLSKASISTVIRQLEQGQLVERVPVPGTRQHHYRVTSGGWGQVARSRVARLRPGIEAAEYGLSIVGADRAEQRRRLEEMRDFYLFVEKEYGEELVRRWEQYRARDRGQHAATPRQPPRERMSTSVAAVRKADSDPPR